MRAGFWTQPNGEDAGVVIAPAAEVLASTKRSAFLATQAASALIEQAHMLGDLLPRVIAALETQHESQDGVAFDVTDFTDDDKKILDEVLGEGEVMGVAALPGGILAHIEEATMTGLWRIRFTDQAGALLADYVEVGAVPHAVRQACLSSARDFEIAAPPEGAMNVMPVLNEIRDHARHSGAGDAPRVINLTLLPMTPEDIAFLQTTLGQGTVRLMSRGYGHCRVTSTAARNVWSVQFTNSMDTIVLDTLELCDVPGAVLAAESDFRESALRLKDMHEAYFQ